MTIESNFSFRKFSCRHKSFVSCFYTLEGNTWLYLVNICCMFRSNAGRKVKSALNISCIVHRCINWWPHSTHPARLPHSNNVVKVQQPRLSSPENLQRQFFQHIPDNNIHLHSLTNYDSVWSRGNSHKGYRGYSTLGWMDMVDFVTEDLGSLPISNSQHWFLSTMTTIAPTLLNPTQPQQRCQIRNCLKQFWKALTYHVVL